MVYVSIVALCIPVSIAGGNVKSLLDKEMIEFRIERHVAENDNSAHLF
jgi:hypothetical protein